MRHILVAFGLMLFVYFPFQMTIGSNLNFHVSILLNDAVIDDPDDVFACGSYALPEITGVNVEGANYYTGINGSGMIINEGTIITNSITLYLFDPDCPSNQPTLNITMEDGPWIENETKIIICEEYLVEPVIGVGITGNEDYFDEPNGSGNLITVGASITSDSTIYIFDDTPGCNINIPIKIDIHQPFYVGEDTTVSICLGDETLYNINELLGGLPPDENGKWSEINSTNIIQDSSAVSFSSLGVGAFDFQYLIEDEVCGDVSSILTVQTVPKTPIGVDSTLLVCSELTDINLYQVLQVSSLDGFFLDEFGMPILFDPTSVDFQPISSSTETYFYIVGDENTICGPDTTVLTVILRQPANAGLDNEVIICKDSLIFLPDLLIGNTDIGTFYDPSNTGGLSGDILDTDFVLAGQNQVLHIVQGALGCLSDTATITINFVPEPNAGSDLMLNICDSEIVDLQQAINGDLGGVFYFNNILLPSPIITYSTEEGLIQYEYVVQNHVSCQADTATISVNRSIAPSINLNLDQPAICPQECASLTVDLNAGFSAKVYFSIMASSGDIIEGCSELVEDGDEVIILLCSQMDTVGGYNLQANTSYDFNIDSLFVWADGCTYTSDLSVQLNSLSSSTSSFTPTICRKDSLIVGSDIYSENNISGITILPNASESGCDSIVEVNLSFFDIDEGFYNNTLCEGQTAFVLGNSYTENITFDTILHSASFEGCDSLVKIELEFISVDTTYFTESICRGTSIFIGENEINDDLIDEEFLVGNGSHTGCDSVIIANITVEENSTTNILLDVCPSFEFAINETIYDSSNPFGEEVVSGVALNGCDSIYIIDLNYNLSNIDSIIILDSCDPDLEIQVGQEIYSIDKPAGSSLIRSETDGCDTIVEVRLNFDLIEIVFDEIDAGCVHPDSGTVNIIEITGTPPYSIDFDDGEIIDIDISESILLAEGTGTLSITDVNGCEAQIDYNIGSVGNNFSVVQMGNQLFLEGETYDSLTWSPSTGLSCTNCPNPTANPATTTIYSVTIYYDEICDQSIEYEFIVFVPPYNVPNIFSPNGDLNNDKFVLSLSDKASGIPLSLEIYDRWGNRLFRENSSDRILSTGWDGTYQNHLLPPGVYVYKIEIQEENSIIPLVGSITLIR